MRHHMIPNISASASRNVIASLQSLRQSGSPQQQSLSPQQLLQQSVSSKQSLSPQQSLRQSVSPKQSLRQSVSPKQSLRQSVSPKQSLRQSVSPKQSLRQSVSPKQSLRQSVSPKQSLRQSVSPKQSQQQLLRPSKENKIKKLRQQNPYLRQKLYDVRIPGFGGPINSRRTTHTRLNFEAYKERNVLPNEGPSTNMPKNTSKTHVTNKPKVTKATRQIIRGKMPGIKRIRSDLKKRPTKQKMERKMVQVKENNSSSNNQSSVNSQFMKSLEKELVRSKNESNKGSNASTRHSNSSISNVSNKKR